MNTIIDILDSLPVLSLLITIFITVVFGGVTTLGFFVMWAVIAFALWVFFGLPYSS